MAKRQIGKCEAVYRALKGLHLQGANIACTFVQSGFPENQSKFIRKVRQTKKDDTSVNDDSDFEGNKIFPYF